MSHKVAINGKLKPLFTLLESGFFMLCIFADDIAKEITATISALCCRGERAINGIVSAKSIPLVRKTCVLCTHNV